MQYFGTGRVNLTDHSKNAECFVNRNGKSHYDHDYCDFLSQLFGSTLSSFLLLFLSWFHVIFISLILFTTLYIEILAHYDNYSYFTPSYYFVTPFMKKHWIDKAFDIKEGANDSFLRMYLLTVTEQYTETISNSFLPTLNVFLLRWNGTIRLNQVLDLLLGKSVHCVVLDFFIARIYLVDL